MSLTSSVPKIKVNITVLKLSGLGFKIIHAKILKTVLSIKPEVIVERLFLIHKYLLFVNLDIFSNIHKSTNF